jgi:uncharacterized membrane-anchored protein
MTLSPKHAGLILLIAQCGIALSVAAKYAADRITQPRVWVRSVPFDPETPLRGRYLALQLLVDGCTLPSSGVESQRGWAPNPGAPRKSWQWPATLQAIDGNVVAHAVNKPSPDSTQLVSFFEGDNCHAARLNNSVNYFIPEHTTWPVSQDRSATVWVEVTVPTSGPPRPIQLALSDATGWHVLKM